MEKITEISKKIGTLGFVDYIYLFGSRVNTPNNIQSDIDLCIVIDNNSDEDLVYESIVDLIQQEKVLIHPIIYSKAEFENKIKIRTYRESIIEKGKLLFKK